MTDLVVAKFGGTSVADFDAMNRSIDVAPVSYTHLTLPTKLEV